MATSRAAAVDIQGFMAAFPSGVGVITALAANRRPWGMTCTAVCSVALDPPTLLVCLRRASPTLEALIATRLFALNLLHDGARPTAELFASGAPDRFARVDWRLPAGCSGPHLTGAAHIVADCEVVSAKPVGDHTVVFATVRRVTRRFEASPLLYGLRRYQRWPVADEQRRLALAALEGDPPGRAMPALIQRLYEVIDGAEWDELRDLFVSDCTYEHPGYEPIVGIERLLDFYRGERIIASGEHHLDHVVGDAVHAATWGHFVGASRDGRALEELFADVFSLRDGRILQRRTHLFRPAV